jgi:SsrA-binding protein
MSGSKKIATNRKALRDYLVEDRIEAGIELRGTEVKSVKAGHINLTGSYANVVNGECILNGLNISPYEFGNRFNHDPERPRRLLLHAAEITKMRVKVEQKGYSLIPMSVYLKRGLVKVEVGICRGKRLVDKRETLKRRTSDREAERAIRDRGR